MRYVFFSNYYKWQLVERVYVLFILFFMRSSHKTNAEMKTTDIEIFVVLTVESFVIKPESNITE